MAHPERFEDDDPYLARVREIALSFPQASERLSHGHPAFFTTKLFCFYGGSVKMPKGHIQHPDSILFWPDPDEKPALEYDQRFFSPAYFGPWGWLGIDLHEDTDWVEIAELIETSYRLTAPKPAVAELDARESTR